MLQHDALLMKTLEGTLVLATGCTEPVAVAYSAAMASSKLTGEILSAEIFVDAGLYKNALRVGIPGIKERGLLVAAALGFLIADPEKKLRILEDISEKILEKAIHLVSQNKIKVNFTENCDRLYIETRLHTKNGKVRVITMDAHSNIVLVEHKDIFEPYVWARQKTTDDKEIQKYTLSEIFTFIECSSIERFDRIKQGLQINLTIAQRGLEFPDGLGFTMAEMIKNGTIPDDIANRAQLLCSAASEMRMLGVKLPVMCVAGSGNHGITVFLTNYAAAQKLKLDDEKLIRALALSTLITIYIKSFTGTLSAMCGCGVAAGIGAAAGVAYQLGGNIEQIFGAMQNMVGSITGIICDGGKEGCAYKVALSSGWAVQSALLAVNNAIINNCDGILVPEFKEMFENMGYICNPGMTVTYSSILKVMSQAEDVLCS